MRAYLAVLKDSLREAMASRVLWVALVAIAVVLLALAPFALRTDTATELRRRELVDAERLVRELDASKDREDTPTGHIWSLLSTDQQTEFATLLKTPDADAEPGRRSRRSPSGMIVRTMNELVIRDDFYKAESWASVELNEQTQALVDDDGLGKDAKTSRNLRLLVAAFPKSIRVQDSTEVSLTYAGRTVVGPLPLAPSDLQPVVESILVFVVSGFLGFVGVFASLLVTAAIIPRTFEPGEISLLLSKPVNRSFLFLTKFFGGCVFTLICAIALVGGVWLLLGFRLGIWEHKLLLCIPVYVFLFSVYYSVSATAGLIWRNAVVALVLVVVFWLVLFLVGLVKVVLDENVFKPAAITEILPNGDGMFVVNGSRQLLMYNPATRAWDQKFKREGQNAPAAILQRIMQRARFRGTRFKPTLDPANDRIFAIEQVAGAFGSRSRGRLIVGREDEDFERQAEGEVPDVATDVFVDSTGRVIIPGRAGIYQFVGQSEAERKTQAFFDKVLGGLVSTPNKKAFQMLQEEETPSWDGEFVAAIHPADDTIFVYSAGEVHRVGKRDDGTYGLDESRNLDSLEDAVLSAGGSHLTIAMGDGSIRVLNATTLEDVFTDQLADGILPRVCTTSADGLTSAILTHDGALWLFDCSAGKPLDWRPPENGDVSAVAFGADGQLMVAAGRQTVNAYSIGSSSPTKQFDVADDWVTRLYDWVINPIYTVLPKPGEVDNFVNYLLTGRKSESMVPSMPGLRANLEEDRVTFDIWKPLWSNVAFVVIMLAFGCFYVSRRDF